MGMGVVFFISIIVPDTYVFVCSWIVAEESFRKAVNIFSFEQVLWGSLKIVFIGMYTEETWWFDMKFQSSLFLFWLLTPYIVIDYLFILQYEARIMSCDCSVTNRPRIQLSSALVHE